MKLKDIDVQQPVTGKEFFDREEVFKNWRLFNLSARFNIKSSNSIDIHGTREIQYKIIDDYRHLIHLRNKLVL